MSAETMAWWGQLAILLLIIWMTVLAMAIGFIAFVVYVLNEWRGR